jgi:hypothetical protein
MVPCPVSSPEELATLVESKRLLDTLYETDYWVARAPKAYQGSVLFWSSMVRIVYAGYERWHPPGYYYQHVTSEPFQVTARILKDFHAKALDDGAERAIVLIFPGEGEIQDQLDGKPPFWSTMTNHLQSAGVPVVDLAPPLTEVVRREGMDAYYRVGHLSPKGNAVVADTLLKALFPSYTAEGVR